MVRRKWRRKQINKILIAGHSSNNRGDEAAINGMTKSLNDLIKDSEFTILADYPEIASKIFKKKNIKVLGWAVKRTEWYPSTIRFESFPKFIQIILMLLYVIKSIFNMFLGLIWILFNKVGLDIPLLLKEKRRVLKEFVDADIILLSPAGPYLGDSQLFWFPIHLYHILLAQLLRKPIMIYAPSVGPFKKMKWVYKSILEGAQVITVREPVSMKYLNELHLRTPFIYLTADCGLLQQPANEKRVKEILGSLGIEGAPLLVGITVSGSGSRYVEEEEMANYKRVLASVADYLVKKHNAVIIFIPHVYGIISDLPLINEIIALMSSSDKARIIPENCTSEESHGIFADLGFLIATRYHSFVLASTVGTPSIVVSYEHKATGYAEMLGLSEYVVNADALDYEEVCRKIDQLLENIEQVKVQMASKIDSLKKLAMFNAKLAAQLLYRNTCRASETT
jgi:polysaccharide pyruvyl transferase WcaK-like protein